MKRLTVPVALSVWLVFGGVTVGIADSPQAVKPSGERNVEAIALEWFGRMRTGQIDRAQLTDRYSDQLTSEMVEATSRYLQKYQYGASPLGTKVLQVHKIGDQTFYVVKIRFPRGDAASLLFGFNANGKITGISLLGMAGD